MSRLTSGLSGSLHAIELPEVLQLLSQGAKTGALVVERGRVRKRIYLRDGAVVCVESSEPREHLGRYLLRAGLIDPATLARAEELREQQGMRLGESLLVLGAIDDGALAAELVRKFEEACFELLRWPGGAFRFVAGAVPGFPLLPVVVGVTGIVMQGMVELDDWRRGIDNLSFRAEPSLLETDAGPERLPPAPQLTTFAPARSRFAWVAVAAGLVTVIVAVVGGATRATGIQAMSEAGSAGVRAHGSTAAGAAAEVESQLLAPPPLPAPRVPPAQVEENTASSLAPADWPLVETAMMRPTVARELPPPAAPVASSVHVADGDAGGSAAPVELAVPVELVAPIAPIAPVEPVEPEPHPTAAATAIVATSTETAPAVIVAPVMTRRTRPRFPMLARELGKTGTVQLRVEVGADGAVLAIREVGPPAGFGFPEAAKRALAASQWRPGTRDGVAVAMWVPVDVAFTP